MDTFNQEKFVSQSWMQDPFIFNLESMDDNDGMKI